MLLVPTSQLVVRLGSKIFLEVWRQVYTKKKKKKKKRNRPEQLGSSRANSISGLYIG